MAAWYATPVALLPTFSSSRRASCRPAAARARFRGDVENCARALVETPMEEWKPEEITAHLDYYRALHKERVASGELVESEILTGPNLAKIVTFDGVTAPVVTDGPFQEF